MKPRTHEILCRRRTTRVSAAVACVTLLFPFAASCERADPVAALPVQTGWSFEPSNPVIALGDLRPLASWNDPCVIRADSGYIMYLTTSMGAPGSPPVLPFRAVSEDGLSWSLKPTTPLLTVGKQGGFDSASVETPSVVLFRGSYHMYYTGVGRKGLSGPMSIGHATSPDGIHWQRTDDPVLSPTGNPSDWNGLQVAEPGAVAFRGSIYLYFTAVGLRGGGSPPAKRVIGLATSNNGTEFGPAEAVVEQTLPYTVEAGFDGYSTPSATVHEDKVPLFYDVGHWDEKAEHKWSQIALHHAVSNDGRAKWSQDSAAIVTRNNAPWTNLEVRSPHALFEDGRVMLWYAGNAKVSEIMDDVRASGKTRRFGIGLATRPTDCP